MRACRLVHRLPRPRFRMTGNRIEVDNRTPRKLRCAAIGGTTMTTKGMRRRNFLKGAASTAAAASLTAGLRLPAAAQSAATRPADLVLKNGKIITIDGRSTITQAVAIAGDR